MIVTNLARRSIPPPNGDDEAKDAAIRRDRLLRVSSKVATAGASVQEGRLGIAQGVGSDNASGSHRSAQGAMANRKAAASQGLARPPPACAAVRTPLSAVAIGLTIPESLRGAPSASAMRSLDEIQINVPSNNLLAVSKALVNVRRGGWVARRARRSTLDLVDRVEALRNKPYNAENNAVYPDDDFGRFARDRSFGQSPHRA